MQTEVITGDKGQTSCVKTDKQIIKQVHHISIYQFKPSLRGETNKDCAPPKGMLGLDNVFAKDKKIQFSEQIMT